jgi:inner membrane protein
MLAPTHFMFALAIAYLLRLPKLPAAIGGIIPDLDVLLQWDFPLMHRGIVHTPLMLAISIVILYLVTDRTTTFAFGAGFLAHLLTDLVTPAGILLLYPLPVFFSLNLVPYNNLAANLGIILWSLGAILLYRSGGFHDWVQRVFSVRLEKPGGFHMNALPWKGLTPKGWMGGEAAHG